MSALLDQWLCSTVRDGRLPDSPSLPRDVGGFCAEIADDGLAPWFYPFVKECPAVPGAVVQDTRRWHENSLVYRDYCIGRLAGLQRRLCAGGRVVLMQGLALCELIYPDPLARHMSDVDLFLPDGNIADVKRVLGESGFKPWGAYENLWQDGTMHVDLHADLWGVSRVSARRHIIPSLPLLVRPSELVAGFHTLAPELAAVQAAFHGVKHAFARRIWMCDVALLAKAGFLGGSAPGSQSPLVSLVLDYLRTVGLAPPALADAAGAVSGLRQRLFHRALRRGRSVGAGEIALASCLPTWRGFLGYLWSSLVPSRSSLADMYGKRPYALQLVCRFGSLLGRSTGLVKCRRAQ
jgi:hypothetical protein